MELWIKLMLLCSCCFGSSADFDGGWPRQTGSPSGLCRYGTRIDCCWGWTRRSWGSCEPSFIIRHRVVGIRCRPQAVCQYGCKHGECIGPDKCKCYPGFTGKTCNQDLNECGLKPRPCKHRCMNTFGSYKCYCLNGYMLMPDGTCGNTRTCAMANCQYGCQVMKGEVRCQCPSPGLRLAPDGRTCMDVDECAAGRPVCPRFRKCVNTFGSYVCKCHDGFELRYIKGKYQCSDVNECVSTQPPCGSFSVCYNTPGSYKCKCKEGYRGSGHDCKAIPKVTIEPPRPGKGKTPTSNISLGNRIPEYDPRTTTVTTTTTTVRAPVTARRPRPTTAVTVPPKRATPRPTPAHRLHLTPYRAPVAPPTHKPAPPTRGPPTTTTPVQEAPSTTARRPPVPEVTTPDDSSHNEITQKPRGDVHIPRKHGDSNVLDINFDIELGNIAEALKDDSDAGSLSCTFDNGMCGWIRDGDGDLHWETAPDPAGGKYLTIPDAGGKRSGRGARLALPLSKAWNSGNLCLSFRHKLSGHRVGALQVFAQRGGQDSPAVWGRTGGQGWRHTQITLWDAALESVILKGERRKGRSGEMLVDDLSLMKGSCTEEHNLRRL